ncbi:hypothetical protein A7D25_23770 [Pseudomonas sp. 21C1]|nr:hypothetical protein A7D25_23770 [Pseudomonas sp. 21C1]
MCFLLTSASADFESGKPIQADQIARSCRCGLRPALQSHYLKMPKALTGLALLFELIEGGREAVDDESTDHAIDWRTT